MITTYSKLNELVNKPKLLLHCCCGPCATSVMEFLMPYFTVIAYYFNPNTEPFDEYQLRLENLKKVCEIYNVELLIGDYDDSFKKLSIFHENDLEGGNRCFLCYENRLRKTQETALLMEIHYFTTTLSVSPYKNSEKINDIGLSLDQQNCQFMYSDFKINNGYKKSIELSKKYGLYRQKYCGCLFSKI